MPLIPPAAWVAADFSAALSLETENPLPAARRAAAVLDTLGCTAA
jgi:hypothetical protein